MPGAGDGKLRIPEVNGFTLLLHKLKLDFVLNYTIFITKKCLLFHCSFLKCFWAKIYDRCHIPDLFKVYTELLVSSTEQCSKTKKYSLY